MSEQLTSDAALCGPRGLWRGGPELGAPAVQTKPLAPPHFGRLAKAANRLSARSAFRPDQLYKREGSAVSCSCPDEAGRSKRRRGARTLETVDPMTIVSGKLPFVVLAIRQFQLVDGRTAAVEDRPKWP